MKIKSIIKTLLNNNLEYSNIVDYSLKEFIPNTKQYKAIYKQIGKKYCWYMKILLEDSELEKHINQQYVKNYYIFFQEKIIGFAEIHFYSKGIYLQYFGLFEKYINKGHGNNSLKLIINYLKKFYFANNLFTTTNNLDHENALNVYLKNGFKEIEEHEEIWDIPDNLIILTERNKKWILKDS